MLSTTSYKSLEDMQAAHPEIKSFTTVHIIPRGQGIETTRNALMKKGIKRPVFIVGCLAWAEAQTTPKVTTCPAM